MILMTASGFAGLGYQIVWTQQGALWLGHESASVLAVVAAFFGGLALGAFAFSPSIEKSRRPARWYAGSEFAIAAWSGVLALIMSPITGWLLTAIGAQATPLWQWTVAFFGTFLLLLPATIAMGATLPAMERVTANMQSQGRSIAALYAGNTVGAVLGVLGTAFLLIPEFGLTRTALFCVALNLFCGATALLAFPKTAEPVQAAARDQQPEHVILVTLVATGLLGIGYEVLVVRVLSQAAEDTVYTFAMLLAVYLIGTALGAAAYHRWRGRIRAAENAQDLLLCALTLSCLIGTATLWSAEEIKSMALRILGTGMTGAIFSEASLALVSFGLPTVVMGALFSHLTTRASEAGIGFGEALAANTLGAAFAPLIFGALALPLFGPKASLLILCLGYLALIAWHRGSARTTWVSAGIAIAFASILAIWVPPLAFIDVPEGGRIVSYREGAMAAVSVVEDANGIARLRINNRQQEGTSATRRVDGRQGLLPVLLHPAPKRALFLGLGTGVTASSAAQVANLDVDAVELLPEVIEASSNFIHPTLSGAPESRLHLLAADARRYVRASDRRYDVIVSDNFHPARSGSGALYTVEHFASVRDRLDAGGVFCQWLPLHQLDIATLRTIVQSFIAVYPRGWAMLASNSLETPVVGLVGRRDDTGFDLDALRNRIAHVKASNALADFGIEDEFALLGGFIAGPDSLRQFAGDAPANTDDRPIVAYRSPRITYAPDTLPRDRLVSLLREVSIEPSQLLANADRNAAERLGAYWVARTRFIEAGRDVRPSSDVRTMLAQTREPLLTVLHISPDFRPAYDPLLWMATVLAQSDVADARGLLLELARTQPARPEATLALRQLSTQTTNVPRSSE